MGTNCKVRVGDHFLASSLGLGSTTAHLMEPNEKAYTLDGPGSSIRAPAFAI